MKSKRSVFATTFRPKERIEAPGEMPGLDETISIPVLASLIAKFELLSGGRRSARDKASKRLRDAVKKGELSPVNDLITFREFLAWKPSKNRWSRSSNKELQAFPEMVTLSGFNHSEVGHPRIYSIPLPKTIAECHDEIRKAYARIISIESGKE